LAVDGFFRAGFGVVLLVVEGFLGLGLGVGLRVGLGVGLGVGLRVGLRVGFLVDLAVVGFDVDEGDGVSS
jgi:hypothetical protein